ncbi:hypothetical protein Fcan01_16200 [Folsomia candida]|uniref:F-box domain-containing protein n=2 Tax=Folsomia candida TaxID=158441 RepID=A0A226DST8_FOLCA|nr:hypothetical protein Fcan01_16200 [Folsomia candida]
MGKFAIATDLGRVGGRMENAVHYGTGETAIISVLWNKEFLHRIFSHLELSKDIKACSLVAKMWAEVGVSVLLERFLLGLSTDLDSPKVLHKFPAHVEIRCGSPNYEHLDKLLAPNEGTMDVESLNIINEGIVEKTFAKFLARCAKYFMNSLTTLSLTLPSGKVFLPPNPPVFPTVTSLCIDLVQNPSCEMDDTENGENFLRLCPNLTNLTIHSALLPVVYGELLQFPEIYQRLESFRIKCNSEPGTRCNRLSYSLLPEVDVPLKKLEITNFFLADAAGPGLLSKIFHRFSTTLEDLEFGWIQFADSSTGTLVWPRMPKLGNLTMHIGNKSDPKFNPELALACVEFVYETGDLERGLDLNYSTQFPALSQLSIISCNETQDDKFRHSFEIYKMLFPHDAQTWDTLTTLDITFPPICSQDEDPDTKRWVNCWEAGKYCDYDRFCRKIAKVLPNLKTPRLSDNS